MKNKILFEDFVNILKTIILEYTYPMKKDVKGNGKGDFQKAGQWGLSNNKIYDEKGKEVEEKKDGFVYRNIPGVKYPFETKENNTQFGEFDKNDAIAIEIMNRLMFGGEKKKPLYLFFNGVVRMIHEGLAGEKNYKMLSDICIYLSENPTFLLKDKNLDPFKDKNWEGGFSDFYGKSFKELVKEFGSAAKQYCKEKQTKVIESDLITSNGYYVYPCYDFATANYVGTFMEQGMCYTGSDNFFHEHMGDSGVLFLFIKKDKAQVYDKNNRVYMGSGNLSLREFGIAVGVNEDKEPYIESITDGTNMSLYNSNYKESKTSKYFNKSDISKLSKIIGTLNGKDIFEYCIKATKERQNSKYDSIFNNGIYNRYDNLYRSKHIDDTTTTEIENLIVFYDNGKFICLDTVQKIVIIITTRGFITINGNEVINANEEPTLIKVSEFIGKFVTNWDGYKHNNRIKRTIEYHNNVPTQEEPSQYRIALEESLKPKVRYNRNIKMKILNEENRVELIGTYKGHNITAMEDEFGMEYYCDDDFMKPFASIEDVKKAIDKSNVQRLVAETNKRSINETILRKIIRNTIKEYFEL
jgi:hypothetical protein